MVSSEVIFFANIRSDAIETPNILETLSSNEYCVLTANEGTAGVFANRYTETKSTFLLSYYHPSITRISSLECHVCP